MSSRCAENAETGRLRVFGRLKSYTLWLHASEVPLAKFDLIRNKHLGLTLPISSRSGTHANKPPSNHLDLT